MGERRKYLRVQGILPVKLSYPDFDILTETKNISMNGAYCSIDKPLEVMTKLSVVLLLPFKKNGSKIVKKINCQGVVVRKEHKVGNSTHPYSVAVYFSEIKDKDKKILHSYITSFCKTAKLSNLSSEEI